MGAAMPSYRVKFFKNLCNCYGRPFTVLQRVIAIRRSKDLHRAVEAAQRRFERLENIPDWKLHADFFESEMAANSNNRHLPA
jgi:hypothetical protein